MAKSLKLYDLFGSEIRSRSNATKVRQALAGSQYPVIDFAGVSFISRSFADELYTITEVMHATCINSTGIVHNMLDIVSTSRNSKRMRRSEHAEIKEFADPQSLLKFLEAM